ncbi:hypothetical protein FRC09_008718 [Ceratobasidium sp. 395]|nr:hypothetical protein FRC09_008718 [Ceratobasidium sp. 395]
MLVVLLPLLMLATSLHDSLLTSLRYHNAAHVSGMISYFFAGGTVSQFFRGSVTFVEFRVNNYEINMFSLASFYRPSVYLDGRYLSLVNRSITASYSGLDELSAVSSQHMTSSYKLEPTRPSAAAAPLRAWAAGQRIERYPARISLITPTHSPAPSVEAPESGTVAAPLMTTGVESATLASSLAAPPSIPIATSLDVLVPILSPVVTPTFTPEQALPGLLTTYPNSDFALDPSPSAVIFVHVIRVDVPVGSIVSELPSSAPAYNFKPEEYTVATSHVVVATSIIISTPVPSAPSHQPTVIPASANYGLVDEPSTWMSRYGWVLSWTVPLALQAGIAIGLYLNQRRPVQCCRQGLSPSPTLVTYAHNSVCIADAEVSDVLKILRLLKELGDLPNIIDEYDITPGELRSHIDLIVETRRSANGQSTVESSAGQPIPASPRNKDSRQDSSPSARLTPAPPSSASRQGRSARASDTTNDSLAIVSARVAALHEGIIDQGAMIDRAFGEIWAMIASPARREELSEGEIPAAGASGSVERRKTDMRALANVSPLAHRTLKRTGGRTTNGALPTPEPSRGRARTQIVEPRAGDHRTEATNDLENTRSVSFNPVAASSPVRATRGDGRNGVSKGLDIRSMSFDSIGTSSLVRARGSRIPVYNHSASFGTRRGLGPREETSPGSTGTLSPPGDGPSLVREPLLPVASAYVSFGTLGEVYLPPRPQAPEPDTTLDSLTEESGEE